MQLYIYIYTHMETCISLSSICDVNAMVLMKHAARIRQRKQYFIRILVISMALLQHLKMENSMKSQVMKWLWQINYIFGHFVFSHVVFYSFISLSNQNGQKWYQFFLMKRTNCIRQGRGSFLDLREMDKFHLNLSGLRQDLVKM